MAIRPPDEGIGTRPLPDQEFEKLSLLYRAALRRSHAVSSSFQSVSREDGLRTWIVRPSRA